MLLEGVYITLMIIFFLLAVFAYCYTFYGVRAFSTRVESSKRGIAKALAREEKKEEKKEENKEATKTEEKKQEEKKEMKQEIEDNKLDDEHQALKQGA